MKEVFEDIYQNRRWYKGSGSGSLPENTQEYRELLQRYIKENEIKSVLDIGCGNWISSCMIDWSDVRYIGVDIVKFLVDISEKRWGTERIRFKYLDATKDKLPDADLVIIKDVFQHWSNGAILSFLPKLKNYKYSLITNSCVEIGVNCEIKNGDARAIDLSRDPFNLNVRKLLQYVSKRPHKNINDTKQVVTLV